MSDDVVILHPWLDLSDEESPLQFARTPRQSRYCAHRKVKLDRELNRVLCRECDAEIDPFKFLLRLTGDWSYWVDAREAAHKRAVAAQARLDETLRLERNARARVKRLDPSVKLPVVPWGEATR